ncbi:MAG TPA: tandem-95 repeat protein, partial [Candidatus Agrococcus pullicola]|nr:tandem-95 repeat protein [Candidatus Agrococcus pullicola]
MLRFIKERKRAAASVGVITAAAVALGVVAFTHPGFTTTDVDMHDGGVWVTNLELNRVGHLNYQAQELDAGLNVPSENFDVVQNDGTVAVIDRMNLNLSPIDTGQASLSGVVPLPGDVDVTIRGGTATILDPADGRLWAFPADRIASFDFQEHDPLAVLGQGGAATADDGGGVHAVSSESGTVHSWQNTEEGFVAVSEEEREQLAEASDLQITSVGEEPVVLDAESGTLFLSNSVTTVPPNSQLQHPGVDRTHVAIASGSELIRQPLAGGEALVEEYASGGPAVAPVQVDGCVYGVWPGDSRVIRDCDDEQGNFDEVIDTAVSDDVVFREHRGVVALNDVVDGVSWLMTDELIMVDNWADLIPPTSEEDSDEIDEESMDDTFENVAPDPSEENNPPVAHDDTIFGARTGRSTLVPVLHNDSDPDGDILTVSLVGDAPDGVRISPVQNASQFQVEIPEDFSSSAVSFRYRVDDGRGGTDEASVTLPIRNASQNAAPEELREQGFEVEQRAQYEHGVLEHWFDPDGDDLFLMDAYSDSGDTVRFNPNGRIVYTATGEPGPTTMTIVVSDGVAETEETIDVEVRERGSSEPIANADYVSVGEGETVSVQPLANDFLPAGDDARLASASPRGDLEVEVDRSTNTLYVTGGAPGTHYVDYTVAAGPNQAQGHVRVDVTEPVEDATPVAVRDVALLPMGEEAIVDLTENDVDPTGGVLVVQSVETDGAPVSVQLLQRHMLRVQDQGGLTERTTLTYNVSNGSETATGEVVIIPVEPPDKPRSPVAVDDTATLREGDFTSIDITENDFSPDNVPFSVEAELVESSLLPGEGHVFVDGDELRVHVVAGGPSYVDVTYEISDEYGNADTASVRIEVEPRDLETNQAPHALEVSSRVLAGNVVRIPIPLNGIDPDGDGVTLVGWESAPDMGRIVEVGPDYIDYEAFSEDSGTTAFQYRVRDRWGAESVSTITIGVAQPGSMNQAPHAATDRVEVRPGRAVAVSVLDNDSDPDGDELSLTGVNIEDAPDGFDDLRTGDEAPTVNFTAPSEPGEYMLEYTIEDARGASAVGTIRVEVSDDAPLQPPEPVDDVVSVEDLTPGEPYVVPVLENDRDVDGDPAELLVDVLTGEGTVVEDGVQVVPGDEFQVITYRATDQDGGEGEAFIFVP